MTPIYYLNKIIWISSFPKSGNTWLRYFLANYFFNKEKIFDQKIIRSIQKFPDDFNIFQKIFFLLFREFLFPGRFIKKIINFFNKK